MVEEAKEVKAVPPMLPKDLSSEQSSACLSLAYCALQLTVEAKKKVSPEQLKKLQQALGRVLSLGEAFAAFPLAVAVWLRDKRELGNRTISTLLLSLCTHEDLSRKHVRHAAKQVIKIPTDLTEFVSEFDSMAVAKVSEGKLEQRPQKVGRPACLKKVVKDVLENLQEYQAAKYDSTTKIKRTKLQLKEAEQRLETLQGKKTDENNQGKGGGKHPLSKKAYKGGALNEQQVRTVEKRISELKSKLEKLRAGDLSSLIKWAHAAGPAETMMGILRKRYPETEAEFVESKLKGEYDEEKVGQRIRLAIPETWDRQLSKDGNNPKTWAALLSNRDGKGHYTMPYMALIRNMRNIMLCGLPHGFLKKHLLARLADRVQIQGSGQTPVALSHAWTMLSEEFNEERLKELREQSDAALRDVLAYHCLRKKLRGPIIGVSDRQVGIVGEFLGEPLWQAGGLKKQNDCFLARNHIELRGGKVLAQPTKGKGKGKGTGKGKDKGGADGPKVDKWLPVALHPPDDAFMASLKEAFEKAIEIAATCQVQNPISVEGPGPMILWLDCSNPPLKSSEVPADDTKANGEKGTGGYPAKDAAKPADEAAKPATAETPSAPEGWNIAGIAYNPKLKTLRAGEECELDEISTHKKLNLELRYFCSSYLDYNIQAYNAAGEHLWNSTYSNVEIKNKKGENCLVHCRDVAGNPSPTEPALRQLHIDVDLLEEDVFAMMITSQLYSGCKPSAVSVSLTENHTGGAKSLSGNHEPIDDKGPMLLAQDISEPLKKGGTCVYGCIYRDTADPEAWIFRNTLDLSLDAESRVASQIEAVTGQIFKKMFQDQALLSSIDSNRLNYVRICQLHQAATAKPKGKGKGKGADKDQAIEPAPVKVLISGVPKRQREPETREIDLTGNYTTDLEVVRKAKKQFSSKSVDADEGLNLVLRSAGCNESTAPSALVRVANNSLIPQRALEEERKKRSFPYGNLDAQGHIFEVFEELPELTQSLFLPAQVESCVTLLRNILFQGSADHSSREVFLRYVDDFLKR